MTRENVVDNLAAWVGMLLVFGIAAAVDWFTPLSAEWFLIGYLLLYVMILHRRVRRLEL